MWAIVELLGCTVEDWGRNQEKRRVHFVQSEMCVVPCDAVGSGANRVLLELCG